MIKGRKAHALDLVATLNLVCKQAADNPELDLARAQLERTGQSKDGALVFRNVVGSLPELPVVLEQHFPGLIHEDHAATRVPGVPAGCPIGVRHEFQSLPRRLP